MADVAPNTVSDWLLLPELVIQEIRDTSETTEPVRVLTVGLLRATLAACRTAGLTEALNEDLPDSTHIGLPTVTIQAGVEQTLFRLPLDLGDWVFTCRSFAKQGINYFPGDVRFCKIRDRYAADID
ncbi:hypothetical protein [Polyangium mundeleinium]|uniref:Uncharacterized protein n=1 Tax=Polyangium mundeleinium TaxID=2995306 RepID=A0ABT5EMQ1_9BACT|nr:hypothetical protein [Polyangium mundeleinium]MDC0743117.1 hypothetical protein [Polyangium mundeleinium]